MSRFSILDVAREHVALPDRADLPQGHWVHLPERGRTWVTDLPGPHPGAPTVILLHAVGCTGQLTWYPTFPELQRRYRVITFDQRWHGRGIVSEEFRLTDCADDVAALITALGLTCPLIAGYSMGSIIAQRVWRQHPHLIGGLILCATTDRFRQHTHEHLFHAGVESAMRVARSVAHSRATQRRTGTGPHIATARAEETAQWALDEFRSTSPWAVGQALAALGRHHSTPWLGRIDVPTAVVVTSKDHVIASRRQRQVAARIPGATVHEVPCGHAGCVLAADQFVPGFLQAVQVTAARARERAS